MHFKNRAVAFKIRKKMDLNLNLKPFNGIQMGKRELFKILQPLLQSIDLLKEKEL